MFQNFKFAKVATAAQEGSPRGLRLDQGPTGGCGLQMGKRSPTRSSRTALPPSGDGRSMAANPKRFSIMTKGIGLRAFLTGLQTENIFPLI